MIVQNGVFGVCLCIWGKERQNYVCPEPFKVPLCKVKPEQDHVLCVWYKTRGTFPLAVQHIYFEGDPGESRTTWHDKLGSKQELNLV